MRLTKEQKEIRRNFGRWQYSNFFVTKYVTLFSPTVYSLSGIRENSLVHLTTLDYKKDAFKDLAKYIVALLPTQAGQITYPYGEVHTHTPSRIRINSRVLGQPRVYNAIGTEKALTNSEMNKLGRELNRALGGR